MAEERVYQRVWQGDDLDDRREASAGDLPEWCLGKVFAPENQPAGDGPPVGAKARGKLADSPWRGRFPHGAVEVDYGAQDDLWAEDAYRRGCDSLPATVAIAAEAQSEALWLG